MIYLDFTIGSYLCPEAAGLPKHTLMPRPPPPAGSLGAHFLSSPSAISYRRANMAHERELWARAWPPRALLSHPIRTKHPLPPCSMAASSPSATPSSQAPPVIGGHRAAQQLTCLLALPRPHAPQSLAARLQDPSSTAAHLHDPPPDNDTLE